MLEVKMRSKISIYLALGFMLCDVRLLANGSAAPPQIRELTPSELAEEEKYASQMINSTFPHLETTPLHIPFDEKQFKYSSEEWKPVKVPKNQQHDPLDTIMMNAVASNPNKQVKISFALPADHSSVTVRYFIFLTKNDKNPTEFKVLLSSNDGMDKTLKIEEPAGRWINSSINVTFEKEDKIVFLAKLGDSTNEIGLRLVTIQKAEETSQERDRVAGHFDLAQTDNTSLPHLDEFDSFTYNNSNKENNDSIINGTVNLLNSINSTLEETTTNLDNISGVDGTITTLNSIIGIENKTGGKAFDNSTLLEEVLYGRSNNKLDLPSNATNDSILSTELPPSNNSSSNDTDTTFIRPVVSPFDESFDVEFGKNQTLAKTNETLEGGIKVVLIHDHDSSLGIFHFFLVIMLISTVIFLFFYIRRKRRRRDDELPVFGRTATEHGNPTYIDDDTELDIGFASSNYRSFKGFSSN